MSPEPELFRSENMDLRCNECNLFAYEHNNCQIRACVAQFMVKLNKHESLMLWNQRVWEQKVAETYYREHSQFELTNKELAFIIDRLNSLSDITTPLNVANLIKKLEGMKY